MPGERDHRLDIVDTDVGAAGGRAASSSKRPFLQVFFRCANQYLRVYRNAAGDGYRATCPTCGRCVNFRVGSGGTSERFFEVSC
jgi:hypothetical protein